MASTKNEGQNDETAKKAAIDTEETMKKNNATIEASQPHETDAEPTSTSNKEIPPTAEPNPKKEEGPFDEKDFHPQFAWMADLAKLGKEISDNLKKGWDRLSSYVGESKIGKAIKDAFTGSKNGKKADNTQPPTAAAQTSPMPEPTAKTSTPTMSSAQDQGSTKLPKSLVKETKIDDVIHKTEAQQPIELTAPPGTSGVEEPAPPPLDTDSEAAGVPTPGATDETDLKP